MDFSNRPQDGLESYVYDTVGEAICTMLHMHAVGAFYDDRNRHTGYMVDYIIKFHYKGEEYEMDNHISLAHLLMGETDGFPDNMEFIHKIADKISKIEVTIEPDVADEEDV